MCVACMASAQSCNPEIISVAATRDLATGSRTLPLSAPPPLENAEWQHVELPHSWRELWPNYEGYAWYRVDWQCAQNAQPQAVAMVLDSIVMAAAIYVNNDLVWRDRNLVEPISRSWNSPRYILFPPSAMHSGVNQLWFHVYGVAHQRAGVGVVQLGEPQLMLQQYADRWQVQRHMLDINLIISFLLGFLSLMVWFFNRSYRLFGWYSLLALSWVLFCLCVVATETWPFNDSLSFAKASAFAYGLLVVCFYSFLWSVVEGAAPRVLRRGLWLLLGVFAVSFLWLNNWQLLQLSGNLFTLIFAISCMHILVYCLMHPSRLHYFVAACLAAIIVTVLRDYLVLVGVVEGRLYYTHYICFVLFIAVGFVLAQRVASNARRIEHFNLELQEAVVSACRDLETTLASEHKLLLDNSLLQERLQLAHELHDGLGGQLARSIALLEHNDRGLDNAQMLSMLKVLRNDLRQIIDSDTSASANVPATPQAWLAATRHRFVTLFDELAIQSSWQIPHQWQVQPNAAQCLALTRVLEESLTNVIKHSRASEVAIALTFPSSTQIQLVINDNGLGFDDSLVAAVSSGIGMRSMRERMHKQRGTLIVCSQPGRTQLTATFTATP